MEKQCLQVLWNKKVIVHNHLRTHPEELLSRDLQTLMALLRNFTVNRDHSYKK